MTRQSAAGRSRPAGRRINNLSSTEAVLVESNGQSEAGDLLLMIRARSHESFRRTTSLIAQGTSLPVVLEAIVQAVEAEDPEIACSIHLLDDARRLLLLAAAPSLPEHYNRALQWVEVGPAMGSCGTAAFLGARVVVEDIANDPRWRSHMALAASAGLAACWSQPILSSDGEVIGTFAIYHPRPARPDAEDLAFIESAAELAAIAVGRQRSQDEVSKSEARAVRAAEVERAAARELTTFFEVSLDMLCIRNVRGEFVRVNKAWESCLGYSVEELEGQPLVRFLHPDDVQETSQVMERVQQHAEVRGFINRYRHRDGHYRHLEWRARMVGEMAFGVARDVTERLAHEAEMQAAKQAAEAANRAKSDFLANMSHEIRTPLNGVIGVVAALSQTELSPAQREMVELIQSSGVTLERLVSDILDLSKIEAGRLEIESRLFDLRKELDTLIELNQVRAQEKGLSFRAELGETARGEFHGDSTRIKQVLGNLLSNAVKFTDRGEVRVRLDLVEPTDGEGPSSLRIEVEDTGVGFDPAGASVLFQRFSQADNSITRRFGGSGLGLSICKALVELMGGEISAQSEPGRGSQFRVVLPLARSLPLAAYDARRLAGPADPGSAASGSLLAEGAALRVLLAEDHPTNQKVVQMILAPFGAEVTVVENGEEALRAFEAASYDLVLMDMQMPVMDGLAATRAIRAREQAGLCRSRTPIVMLSANAMLQHRREALGAGADLHLSKPVTAAALIGGIEEVLPAAPAV